MRAMRRLVLVALLVAGCATGLGGPSAMRAPGYRGAEVRRPALTVRLGFGPGDFTKQERAELPEVYTTALLDALNAQAVVPVDVQVTTGKLDRAAAVARARDVGADQAVIVEATAGRGLRTYCRNSRRMFTTRVTGLVARVDVVRVTDGQTRLTEPDIEAGDFEEDCDAPKESRRLGADELIADSVRKVLAKMLRP